MHFKNTEVVFLMTSSYRHRIENVQIYGSCPLGIVNFTCCTSNPIQPGHCELPRALPLMLRFQ